MITHTNTAESRIRNNRHFAAVLRKRLESRHPQGAVREIANEMSDEELVSSWLSHQESARQHAAERLAAKENRT